MPEGDTIHGLADRLGTALVSQTIARASGSHRAMIEFGRRLVGTEIIETAAHGKHLLIHFSNGWTLRTHLQMTGEWHIYAAGERWKRSPGKARVVLETGETTAVCFSAPTVQLAPWHIVAKHLDALGPDLMTDVESDSMVDRLYELAADRTIGDAIIDQSVVAGLGNVYKSEVLFLEGVHPDMAVALIDRPTASRLFARGHRLLVANRGRGRTTTGVRRAGNDFWVYGRAGSDCRRCRTPIETGRRGELGRTTYWCPSCQPPPQR